MADFVKRANYFDNQFVRAADFNLEQDYQVSMRRRHNRDLHTWGVVPGGLEVQLKSGAQSVTVSPGMAIDGRGQEVVLLDPSDPIDLSGIPADKPAYIVVSYSEAET